MEIKKCPICGEYPKFEVSDMGRPNGRGYQGSYSYTYYCECGYMKRGTSDTVYNTEKEAPQLALDNWNKEVDKLEIILSWRND